MFHIIDWLLKKNQNQGEVGIVEDINDSQHLGAVRVRITRLHGKIPTEYLPWASPKFNGSNGGNSSEVNLPAVGSKVRVTFIDGDYYNPCYEATLKTKAEVDESFMEGYPNFRGWKTPAGNIFKVKEDSSWNMETPNGTKIQQSNGTINCQTPDGTRTTIKPDSIQHTTSDGTNIHIEGDKVTVTNASGAQIKLMGKSCTVTGIESYMCQAEQNVFHTAGTTDQTTCANKILNASSSTMIDTPSLQMNGQQGFTGTFKVDNHTFKFINGMYYS